MPDRSGSPTARGQPAGPATPGRPDRGQLLLVGAITLALILLGLVVIFNTVLYTDTKSGTASIDDAREAQGFNQQVKNDSVRIANELERDVDKVDGNLGDMVEENVSRYSEAMAAAHVDRGPIFVNVTVENVAVSGGDTVDTLEVHVVYETDKIRYENVWELDP